VTGKGTWSAWLRDRLAIWRMPRCAQCGSGEAQEARGVVVCRNCGAVRR